MGTVKKRRKSSRNSNVTYSNGKKIFMASAWVVIVVALIYFVGRYFINDIQAKDSAEKMDFASLVDVNLKPGMEVNVWDYTGHRTYFNKQYHIPNCVSYELIKSEVTGAEPRYKNFEPDPNFKETAYPSDYTHSGYDRGHMAPAGDMKWSKDAMHETFYMSNICPQNHSLNSGGWHKLEKKIRDWADRDSVLIVITGPILSSNMKTIGENHVAVPTKFFKAILAPAANPVRAIGFIYDNEKSVGGPQDHAVSISDIELETGYDFFSSLPDDIETKVESICNYKEWSTR